MHGCHIFCAVQVSFCWAYKIEGEKSLLSGVGVGRVVIPWEPFSQDHAIPGGPPLGGGSKAKILRSALTLKGSVVQRLVPMGGRCSPFQRNSLGARRRKLEGGESRVAGLQGHQGSSSGEMGREATSASPGSELAWAGSDADSELWFFSSFLELVFIFIYLFDWSGLQHTGSSSYGMQNL